MKSFFSEPITHSLQNTPSINIKKMDTDKQITLKWVRRPSFDKINAFIKILNILLAKNSMCQKLSQGAENCCLRGACLEVISDTIKHRFSLRK